MHILDMATALCVGGVGGLRCTLSPGGGGDSDVPCPPIKSYTFFRVPEDLYKNQNN